VTLRGRGKFTAAAIENFLRHRACLIARAREFGRTNTHLKALKTR
jgi:hypothetical protein